MSDLISRQAAIDALNEYFVRIGKLKRRGLTKGEKAISLDTVGAIKTLPSAQLEIIRCCKCAFWDRDTLRHQSNDFREWNEAECKILAERDPYHEINRYTEADDYCSYAERRTDERYDIQAGGDSGHDKLLCTVGRVHGME